MTHPSGFAKTTGWFLGCGATLVLVTGLLGLGLLIGATPFSPGSLGAEHPQNLVIAEFASHADFQVRCEFCHAPFHGPDGSRCMNCHTEVRAETTLTKGIHGQLPDPQKCTPCHTDHKGRAASLTRAALVDMPHSQFGFSLALHQRDYNNAALTCQSCHAFATPAGQIDSAGVLATCVACHARHDARFVAEHRAAVGEACLACHDGTDRLRGFDHATVFGLEGKHAPVACARCHINNRFRGTPTACLQCHADPVIHRGQFGNTCEACHTAAGWRPARLMRHTFPLEHGGKPAACQVCHPANYATYTCYNCHEHDQNKITREHAQANLRDIQPCAKCHPTGKKKE